MLLSDEIQFVAFGFFYFAQKSATSAAMGEENLFLFF